MMSKRSNSRKRIIRMPKRSRELIINMWSEAQRSVLYLQIQKEFPALHQCRSHAVALSSLLLMIDISVSHRKIPVFSSVSKNKWEPCREMVHHRFESTGGHAWTVWVNRSTVSIHLHRYCSLFLAVLGLPISVSLPWMISWYFQVR